WRGDEDGGSVGGCDEMVDSPELAGEYGGAGSKWSECGSDDLSGVGKRRSFERHISKSTKPHPCFYNNDYTYLVDLSTEEKYTTSITKYYAARYYKEGIGDRIPERWSKEVHHYHFEALNVGTGDPMIKSMNSAMQIYLDSLSEVKKFCDGTLVKIQENQIDMLSKNKLGSSNKRLKGRDWTNYDVKSLKEMLKKLTRYSGTKSSSEGLRNMLEDVLRLLIPVLL
ncbi:hypothetical protein Tco_1292600, partial [Tanacetum coccineum]